MTRNLAVAAFVEPCYVESDGTAVHRGGCGVCTPPPCNPESFHGLTDRDLLMTVVEQQRTMQETLTGIMTIIDGLQEHARPIMDQVVPMLEQLQSHPMAKMFGLGKGKP